MCSPCAPLATLRQLASLERQRAKQSTIVDYFHEAERDARMHRCVPMHPRLLSDFFFWSVPLDTFSPIHTYRSPRV
jgi:hypothetical protein